MSSQYHHHHYHHHHHHMSFPRATDKTLIHATKYHKKATKATTKTRKQRLLSFTSHYVHSKSPDTNYVLIIINNPKLKHTNPFSFRENFQNLKKTTRRTPYKYKYKYNYTPNNANNCHNTRPPKSHLEITTETKRKRETFPPLYSRSKQISINAKKN